MPEQRPPRSRQPLRLGASASEGSILDKARAAVGVAPLQDAVPQHGDALALPSYLSHLKLIPTNQIQAGRYQKRLEAARDQETYAQLKEQMASDYAQGKLKLFLFVMPDPEHPGMYVPCRGGHRRLAIAQEIGVPDLLCEVIDYDASDLASGTYFENEGRQDYSLIEKGLLFQAIMTDEPLLTEATLAERYHVKGGQPYVSRCITSAGYEPDLQALIFWNPEKTTKVVRVLAALDALEDHVEKRAPMIQAFTEGKLTADQVETAVKDLLQGIPFALNENRIKEVVRTEGIALTSQKFDRWYRTRGDAPLSSGEREHVLRMRQLLDSLLQR